MGEFVKRFSRIEKQALRKLDMLNTARDLNDLRARVDDLAKKVRGIDALEQRIAKLEHEVTALKRASKPKAAAKPPA